VLQYPTHAIKVSKRQAKLVGSKLSLGRLGQTRDEQLREIYIHCGGIRSDEVTDRISNPPMNLRPKLIDYWLSKGVETEQSKDHQSRLGSALAPERIRCG
jgi:hypothetical protein